MKILIAVPTKGCIDTIGKDTLSWLPNTGKDWILAVEPQEATLYKRFYPQYANNLLILPENNRGLMYSLLAIRAYAEQHGYEAVFKVDDDIRGWYGKDRKMAKDSSKTFLSALARCEERLKEANVGAIAFPYSQAMFDVSTEWSPRGKTITCYLVKTKHWYIKMGVHGEDIAVLIYLRSIGMDVLRYNWLGISCKPVGKTPGGLQLFDRRKLMAESNAILQKDFPFLKLKDVKDKPWDQEPDMRSIP